ncbi:MAG: response regulator [Magnetospirillum sp.]|nr:response regulator [Magnetospirillum sp.]
MFLTRIRIVTRLSAGFGAVLLLTVIMSVLAVRTMLSMAEMATDLYSHPFMVTNALLQVESQINAMRADMLMMIHNRSPADVVRLSRQVAAKEADMEAAMEIVRSQYLGKSEDVLRLIRELAEWKVVRDQNIRLCQDGRFDAAAENSRANGNPQIVALRDDIATIYAFARAKAAEFSGQIEARRDAATRHIVMTMIALILLGLLLSRLITRSIVVPLDQLRHCMGQLSDGDLNVEIPDRSRVSEVAKMAAALTVFKESALRLESQRWVKDGLTRLSPALQGAMSTAEFASAALDILVPLMGAAVGVFHLHQAGGLGYRRLASWGLASAGEDETVFDAGEGLAGEAVRQGRILCLDNLPEGYLRIASATGGADPATVLIVPVINRGTVLAVLEFAGFAAFDDDRRALIEAAQPVLALNLEILERNLKTQELLEETQTQAEELRSSEEELRSQSEALQSANEELRVSEEELKVQQEALQAANEELRLKGESLEERGAALEAARAETDRRAVELELANRYKSEFLANMSHELRTPLNSVLILARNLADNDEGNLTADQVESARVVHESGTHLLSLINDVLDLSKVEAGKMTLNASTFSPEELADGIRRRFAPVAADKGLAFAVTVEGDLPAALTADRGKIEQIANNLVSNALKFTAEGGVTIRLGPPSMPLPGELAGTESSRLVALSVADTGIGIAPQDQHRVFQAFEQVDSGTSRQFGGTGLGLTISRRLARLMGGDIVVAANQPRGTLFTLLLPLESGAALTTPPPPRPAPPADPVAAANLAERPVRDDGHRADGKVLLVVEDDSTFQRIVCDLARQKGYATITANDGLAGLEMARLHRPSGIVIDIGLPGMNGWEVIERLSQSPETSSIPIHVISADDERRKAASLGTVGYLTKPVSREQINSAFETLLRAEPGVLRKHLLVVDGDAAGRAAVAETLAGLDVEITPCASGAEALLQLTSSRIDCLILDLDLPDMTGNDLLEKAGQLPQGLPPVIVFSDGELSRDQTLGIREFTDSIVIKGTRSPERLRDEVSLFLHSVENRASVKPRPAAAAAAKAGSLSGHTILLVDDDMRNAFALSKVLRGKGLKVLIAQDGAKALSQLAGQETIDLVLMDIMMPGMDGYQTMAEIRKQERFADLPIIALTAKAMAGDRDKCIRAGANDYLPKPVEIDRLQSAMQRLLDRGKHAEQA